MANRFSAFAFRATPRLFLRMPGSNVTASRAVPCGPTLRLLSLAIAALCPLPAPTQIPVDSRQVILGLSDSWESTHVELSLWRREPSGPWSRVGTPWKGRLGKDGLGWGIGLHPPGLPGPIKTEKDARAPGGIFELGDAYGYATSVPTHPNLRYHTVGPRDLWVDDPTSKYYNQHIRLAHPAPRTEWERKQQMRLNDHAHSLKLFIKHNAPPDAKAGMGSAIFFHIWRDNGRRYSAGCTTMPEDRLRQLLTQIDPAQHPLFVLLPKPAYQQLRGPWHLP